MVDAPLIIHVGRSPPSGYLLSTGRYVNHQQTLKKEGWELAGCKLEMTSVFVRVADIVPHGLFILW